jgi:3-dehydroquinate synthase
LNSFTVSGAGWSHEVIVGELPTAAAALRRVCGDRPVPVVTDERVLALHGSRLESILDIVPITIPEGEESKNWTTLQQLTERFVDLGLTRDRPVIAFGGGSVGDVAGLAASLFKRGCAVVNIPTSLLAQVDSALGGKTAIDACGQKNLIGTFHPPALVVCDPAFLETLDERQLRAGYAEVVKYGLIGDQDFFAWCEANGAALLGGSGEARLYAVEHCLRAKARLIGDDLHDLSGRRALLNLGHSFGHAIETLTGFEAVLHGEAVAVGMTLAFALSLELGLCPPKDVERVRSHFANVRLPTTLAAVGLGGRGADLLPLLGKDKKASAAGPVLILARGIGRAFVAREIDPAQLADFLHKAD